MSTAWRSFNVLGASRRRAVVAVPVVGLAHAVTGSTVTLTIAAVSAAVLLMLLHERGMPDGKPSPEQLRAIDAHQAAEDADALTATGAGEHRPRAGAASSAGARWTRRHGRPRSRRRPRDPSGQRRAVDLSPGR